MAFDAVTPSFSPAPVARPAPPSMPVRAGGYISLLDRAVLTFGYTAFGAAVGAGVALLLGRLAPEMVTMLAVAPMIAALIVAAFSMRLVNARATPLLVLVIAAALASPASVFLYSTPKLLDAAAFVFTAALLSVSLLFCRRFAAAFSLALLGMLLAAPMGAASVVWAFGR